MTILLERALDYAKRGWYVFPCREKPGTPYLKNEETVIPGEKTPYTSRGLLDATRDEDQVRAWWKAYPDAMIGVNCGLSGLFVIDIDNKHVNGLETYDKWGINDSAGLVSVTPSGGMHIIFSGKGKTSTNPKTGIDTRGEGGYIIAPPSKILEGENAGEYRAERDWGKDPGVIPDGLFSKLFPEKENIYDRESVVTDTGEKRHLSRATLEFLLVGASVGERNSKLFVVACDFAGNGYSMGETREILQPVSDRMDFPRGEFEEVLEKAFSKPRESAIPLSIQEKISSGKMLVNNISQEEQSIMEDAVLACMILDNTVIPVIDDILFAEDFSLLRNQFIYKKIIKMYNFGMKVDFLTVTNEINKDTDKITLDDISKLINRYLDDIKTENAIAYAKIIREKASIRKLETIMDNKKKYLRAKNLIDSIYMIEKDITDVALYGGVKSTNLLTSKQATAMVQEFTKKIVDGEIQQLQTGFRAYDVATGGFYPNELVVCAARSGEGKSALALTIANEVAISQNKAVGFFSLEMSTHESICRLICQLTGLPFRDVYKGRLSTEGWEKYYKAMDVVSKSKIFWDDTFGITLPEIRSKIRKLLEEDVKLIIIDQLEQVKAFENMPTYIQFDKICYAIKDMTQEFQIPIILNHQLNRNITDRRLKNPTPQLSDLNQAGEKAANQVWAIRHRKDDNDKIIQSKICILKNRNGPRLEFPVTFVGERMLFSNPIHGEDIVAFKDEEEPEGNVDGTPWFVKQDD